MFSEIAENIYKEIQNNEGDYDFDMAELQWLKEEFTESEEINQKRISSFKEKVTDSSWCKSKYTKKFLSFTFLLTAGKKRKH